MTNDLNKRCASLCLEPDDGMDVFYWSDITGRFTHYEDMHFHDSYDWAMLLVAECVSKSPKEKRWETIKTIEEILQRKFGCPVLWATPQQISEACLEVLNG